MKEILRYAVLLAIAVPFWTACDDYSCSEAQDDVDAAGMAYTDAIDAGGDGQAECIALRAAMQRLIDESTCPSDIKDATEALLGSVDCN